MGPGLAIKAIAGNRLSLMVFGFSQVAIDIEPLVHLIQGDAIVHRFTHTYLGATLIAAGSVVVGRPVCQFLLDCWNPPEGARFEAWVRGPRVITWPAAIAGAVIGTSSHVFLDSIVHSDMHPLAPFSERNALLDAIGFESMHLWCVLSGVLGALLVMARFLVILLATRR
jgi:hypothetical protein